MKNLNNKNNIKELTQEQQIKILGGLRDGYPEGHITTPDSGGDN